MFLAQLGESDSLVWGLGFWAAVDGVFRDVAHATGGEGEEGEGFAGF